MIRVSHTTLYALSGAVWLVIGMFLLNLGLQLITKGENPSSFFAWLSEMMQGFENAGITLICSGLVIGFLKGRMVLQKVAQRSYLRIQALDNPTSILNLYAKANLFVIGGMMTLGMLFKLLGLPCDIRGFIDTAVGTALMQGSLAYFHMATSRQKASHL